MHAVEIQSNDPNYTNYITQLDSNQNLVKNKNQGQHYFSNNLWVVWIICLILLYGFSSLYFFHLCGTMLLVNYKNWTKEQKLPDLNKSLSHAFFMGFHIIAGFITMYIGLLQISNKFRGNNIKCHKILGYIDLGFTFITSVCGILFIVVNKFKTVGGINMSIAFFIGGLWFFITGVFTLYYAIKKNIDKHKMWALRCYFMSIASMLYRAYFSAYMVFLKHQPPRAYTQQTCNSDGTCNDYLRKLDQFNAWWFILGGELLLEFAIYSKRHMKLEDIRDYIMDALSIVCLAVVASPFLVMFRFVK